MGTLHKRLIIFVTLLIIIVTVAAVKLDILEVTYKAPSEYSSKEEQDYRENMQLKIQELEKRIKVLEGGQ